MHTMDLRTLIKVHGNPFDAKNHALKIHEKVSVLFNGTLNVTFIVFSHCIYIHMYIVKRYPELNTI